MSTKKKCKNSKKQCVSDSDSATSDTDSEFEFVVVKRKTKPPKPVEKWMNSEQNCIHNEDSDQNITPTQPQSGKKNQPQ